MKTTFILSFAALLTIGLTNPSNAQHFEWKKLITVNPGNNSFERVHVHDQSAMYASGPNQVAVVPAGGSVSNEAGFFSYTLGQVVYTAYTGNEGTVSQGIQQGVEISAVTGLPEAEGIQLLISAYPNPLSDYLILRAEDIDIGNLRYQLFTISGTMIVSKRLESNQTSIPMSEYAPGTYLVKVTDGRRELKVFRVVKR